MSVLFSLIVPVYNVERYLAECVESLLGQSMRDFEVILVDDGSTDRSGILCDEFEKRDRRVRVIHQCNQGLSAARNRGIESAGGEYLSFIDSDDYVAADFLQNAAQKIAEVGETEILLTTGWYKVYRERTVLEDTVPAVGEGKPVTGKAALQIYLRNGTAGWSACGKIYKREFWKNNGFRFKAGIYYEDAQLIYRIILKAESVCYIPPAYYYRKTRNTSILSNIGGKQLCDYIDILKEWDEYLDEASYESAITDGIREIYAMEYVCSILPSVPALAEQERKQVMQEARRIGQYLYYSDKAAVRLARLARNVLGFPVMCRLLFWAKKIKGGFGGNEKNQCDCPGL